MMLIGHLMVSCGAIAPGWTMVPVREGEAALQGRLDAVATMASSQARFELRTSPEGVQKVDGASYVTLAHDRSRTL
jgi:hypothetical protein